MQKLVQLIYFTLRDNLTYSTESNKFVSEFFDRQNMYAISKVSSWEHCLTSNALFFFLSFSWSTVNMGIATSWYICFIYLVIIFDRIYSFDFPKIRKWDACCNVFTSYLNMYSLSSCMSSSIRLSVKCVCSYVLWKRQLTSICVFVWMSIGVYFGIWLLQKWYFGRCVCVWCVCLRASAVGCGLPGKHQRPDVHSNFPVLSSLCRHDKIYRDHLPHMRCCWWFHVWAATCPIIVCMKVCLCVNPFVRMLWVDLDDVVVVVNYVALMVRMCLTGAMNIWYHNNRFLAKKKNGFLIVFHFGDDDY